MRLRQGVTIEYSQPKRRTLVARCTHCGAFREWRSTWIPDTVRLPHALRYPACYTIGGGMGG